MTTGRPDGQSVPVWFLWDGEAFPIFSLPDARKPKNIARNPRVNLNLNSNEAVGDVARVECTAEALDDAPQATEVAPYVGKYGEGIRRIGMDPDGFAAAPARWQAW